MGKIWLKSVDPAKQCCGCEGKVGPCDSCCSFDLTEFEGYPESQSDADKIFKEKLRKCRYYFPVKEIADQSQVGDNNNIIQSINFDSDGSGKTYIDSDNIIFYHTDGYPKDSSGSIVITTDGKIIDSSKKITPPREDFCSENKVRYNTKPPLEYDIDISYTLKKDGGFFLTLGTEEIDKPEEEYTDIPTEKKYSEISKGVKITTEICCKGKVYKFVQLYATPSNLQVCLNKSLGVYRSFAYTENNKVSAGFTNNEILYKATLQASKWRFDPVKKVGLLDIKGQMVITKSEPINYTCFGLYFEKVTYSSGTGILTSITMCGTPATGTSTYVDETITIPLSEFGGVFPILYPIRIADTNKVFYLLADCDSLIAAGTPDVTEVGEIPECDPNYACIKKDNIVKYKEIIGESGARNDEDCPPDDASFNDMLDSISGQNSITPNILGIIALSIASLIGGGLVGMALIVATGVLGLGLAAGLVYYSIQVGAKDAPDDQTNPSYEFDYERGNDDNSCEFIGEGNILKTTEIYSIVGKKILFPPDGPPKDVTPYSPKYKTTALYYTGNESCVLIETIIKRGTKPFNGICSNKSQNLDNIAIAYKSEIIDDDQALLKRATAPKLAFLKVQDRRYNCNEQNQ